MSDFYIAKKDLTLGEVLNIEKIPAVKSIPALKASFAHKYLLN